MDQARALQGMVIGLFSQAVPGDAAQFAVNQRNQFLAGRGIASTPLMKQLGDFAGGKLQSRTPGKRLGLTVCPALRPKSTLYKGDTVNRNLDLLPGRRAGASKSGDGSASSGTAPSARESRLACVAPISSCSVNARFDGSIGNRHECR